MEYLLIIFVGTILLLGIVRLIIKGDFTDGKLLLVGGHMLAGVALIALWMHVESYNYEYDSLEEEYRQMQIDYFKCLVGFDDYNSKCVRGECFWDGHDIGYEEGFDLGVSVTEMAYESDGLFEEELSTAGGAGR